MISVITVVYNGERFLAEAIQSILIQEEDFELIIVNDGSTDRTEEIIDSFQDERIRYFEQENRGEAAARNVALSFAKGDFIVWQDADDISVPGRLQRMKKEFDDPTIDFAHSDVIYIDENGIPFRYQNMIVPETNEHLLRTFIKTGTPFQNVSMMLRRTLVENLRFDTALKCGTDTAFVHQFVFKAKGAYIPLPLLLYRRHTQTMGRLYEERKLHFPPLKKLLASHPIEQLVPEAFSNGTLQPAVAYAILYYFFRQRRFAEEADPFLEKAEELAKGDPETLTIIEGFKFLAEEQYQKGLDIFCQLPSSAVVENAIAEALIFLTRNKEAYEQLLEALKKYPQDDELLDHLKIAAIRLAALPSHG